MVEPLIYTVGGTVQTNEQGLYIPRPADAELLNLCQKGEFAYVLTPRQMGKSSLMVRTAEQLIDNGGRAVIIDLGLSGTLSSAEEWYHGLLNPIVDQLILNVSLDDWWEAHGNLGLTQRLTLFLQQVVLDEVRESIVIFVDEIDTTLSLNFTDDFFVAIRSLYVARATQPELRRLSFVLIGVAMPGDLIRDPRRTPFNIGHRVDLTDFTLAEALPLAAGFGLSQEEAEQILGRLLKWTGGHPYLTQRLCQAIAKAGESSWSEAAVEQLVTGTFLGRQSEQDNNLQFVRDMLTKRAPNIFEVLTTYQAVLRSRPPVIDEEQSIFKSHLKLSGVVKRDGKILKVRNDIYKAVFDDLWIKSHFPVNWAKRLQRAATILIGLVLFSSVPLAAFGWLQFAQASKQREIAVQKAIEADQQRQIADQQRASADQQRRIAEAARQEADRQRVIAQQQRQIADQLRKKAENARSIAEQRRQQAETSQQETEQQRAIAEKQGQIAEQQRAIAEKQSQIAEQQRDIANKAKDEANKAKLAQSLSAQALALRDTFPQRSLLLGIESIKLDVLRKTEARALLHRLLGEIGGIPLIGHEKPVITVEFTPDGKWLATGSQDGTVRLWDKNTPNRPPTILQSKIGEIKTIAISPDGKWLAAIGSGTQIQLWNLTNTALPPLTLTGHRDEINTLAFSPNSQWLATASKDKTVRLWNMTTRVPGSWQVRLEGHTTPVRQAIFSASGKWLATAEEAYKDGKSIRLWDIATLSPSPRSIVLQGQPFEESNVLGLAFSPDEKHVAAAISYSVQVWDLTAQNLSTAVPIPSIIIGTHRRWLHAITFSPDSRWLATGWQDIKLWDMKSLDPAQPRSPDCETDTKYNVCRFDLRGHTADISSLRFSSQGKWLASSSTDGTARLWDITDLLTPPIVLRGHEGWVNAIAFDPEGKWLATASQDTQARLWNLPDGLNDPIVYRTGGGIASVALSREWVAVAGRDHVIRLWSRTNPLRPLILLTGHTGDVQDLAFTHNGHWLASASEDGTARLWKVDSDNPAANSILLEGHTQGIQKLAISPDDHWVATGSWDTTIRLWDLTVTNPRDNPRILHGHRSAIRSLAFSRDGRYLISGSGDNVHYGDDAFALVWDMTASNPSAHPRMLPHHDIVVGVALSPDNHWAATAGWDGTARLWDMTASNPSTSAAKVIKFDPVDRVSSVAFSPDGYWLAAGSWANQVKIQDMINLAKEPYELLDHRGLVSNVQFSPDGQWLATSSEDQTVRLWNPKDFTAAPVILRGHDVGIVWLAFSPDGHSLLSGSSNDARLWRVDETDLITLACRTAGRNLTQAEWQPYLPGQPHRLTCPDLLVPKGTSTTDQSILRQPEQPNLLISLVEQIRALWHW